MSSQYQSQNGITFIHASITVANKQQDMQCMYNVTRGAFMQPLLQWKIGTYYTFRACICRLRYPALNVHVPYCHLWPAHLYYIFPHYLKKGTIFEEKLLNINRVFRFTLQLLSEIFLILRTVRDVIKNVYWSSSKESVIQILMTLEFSS